MEAHSKVKCQKLRKNTKKTKSQKGKVKRRSDGTAPRDALTGVGDGDALPGNELGTVNELREVRRPGRPHGARRGDGPALGLHFAAHLVVHQLHFLAVLHCLAGQDRGRVTRRRDGGAPPLAGGGGGALTSTMRLTSVVSAWTRWKLAMSEMGRKP